MLIVRSSSIENPSNFDSYDFIHSQNLIYSIIALLDTSLKIDVDL